MHRQQTLKEQQNKKEQAMSNVCACVCVYVSLFFFIDLLSSKDIYINHLFDILPIR